MSKNREMMTISLSPDTKARLITYAREQHKSASQAITDWIWQQPVKTDGNGDGKENGGAGNDN